MTEFGTANHFVAWGPGPFQSCPGGGEYSLVLNGLPEYTINQR